MTPKMSIIAALDATGLCAIMMPCAALPAQTGIDTENAPNVQVMLDEGKRVFGAALFDSSAWFARSGTGPAVLAALWNNILSSFITTYQRAIGRSVDDACPVPPSA